MGPEVKKAEPLHENHVPLLSWQQRQKALIL